MHELFALAECIFWAEVDEIRSSQVGLSSIIQPFDSYISHDHNMSKLETMKLFYSHHKQNVGV